MNIKLVKDTIDFNDIKKLISWLEKNPKLTKGDYTIKFEKEWSKWLGIKYSVFVNSGSSANLAAIYSLILSGKLKNNKIVVPAVSWVTTVTPAIQLGLEPIMCDCDKDNLGLDVNHLKQIIKEENPSAIILVHVLGYPNHMTKIIELCKEHDILLIEDTCESIGSSYNNKKLGTFGDLSTFSFYFGHHMSTIEGGMISTNDEDLYHILLSIRSHGWDRDITKNIENLVKALNDNNIECRPLICGSINEHPFWYERYGHKKLPISKTVHEYGLYIPNNHQMTEEEIDKVIKIVNENI